MPEHHYDHDGNYIGYSLTDAERDGLKRIEIQEWQERHKNDARDQANFNRGCAILVVVIAVIGLGTLLYNKISDLYQKHEAARYVRLSKDITLAPGQAYVWNDLGSYKTIAWYFPESAPIEYREEWDVCCGLWTRRKVRKESSPRREPSNLPIETDANGRLALEWVEFEANFYPFPVTMTLTVDVVRGSPEEAKFLNSQQMSTGH